MLGNSVGFIQQKARKTDRTLQSEQKQNSSRFPPTKRTSHRSDERQIARLQASVFLNGGNVAETQPRASEKHSTSQNRLHLPPQGLTMFYTSVRIWPTDTTQVRDAAGEAARASVSSFLSPCLF